MAQRFENVPRWPTIMKWESIVLRTLGVQIWRNGSLALFWGFAINGVDSDGVLFVEGIKGEVSLFPLSLCDAFLENLAFSLVETRSMSVDFVPCRLSNVSSMNRSTRTAATKYSPAINKLGSRYG